MTTILVNPDLSDDERRQRLYRGEVVVYSAVPESLELVEHARALIAEAFGSRDPQTAQDEMPVDRFAALLADLKPRFIHHPRSKDLIRNLLGALQCDLDVTYFDVPRMRTSTADNYLVTGISYAFHAHRDTWYSAPLSQLNWWLPIYPVVPENVMAFHPHYWDTQIRNSSRNYDYQEWNRTSRYNAVTHIQTDTRVQPKAEELVRLDPEVRVVPEPGGLMLFSANQLHSTVPNTSGHTRFSIDFRTVHLGDIRSGTGASHVDSYCTGTSLRDFLRGSDFDPITEQDALSYERKTMRWAESRGRESGQQSQQLPSGYNRQNG